MSKKSAENGQKQGARERKVTAPEVLAGVMQQLVLPLVVGIEATKNGLLAFVHQMGLLAMQELFAVEAAAIAGPKGKHAEDRSAHHWGTARVVLPFGGRNIVVEAPRVRPKGKGRKEIPLPSVEAFRASDPLAARVAEQIVLGVSTRGYERSLDASPKEVTSRGASKSAASRALIEKTQEKVTTFVERRLEGVDLVAMFIDGIEIAKKTVVVALGVATNGTKVPLGLWMGSTENAVVATELLQNLVARGLRVDGKQLLQLATWLENNGEESGAASLREGMDETLTVLGLNLPWSLLRTFSTTNAIENMNGTLRRVCRNVKRWRDESMIRRWVAMGIEEAQSKFRRVKGHKQMSSLISALRPTAAASEVKLVA